MQSAQPSASILQSVLAWQQQRSAATRPQSVCAASLQAGGLLHGMQHPQQNSAAVPLAAPLMQRQPGASSGFMPPWMLQPPQLSAGAPMAHLPPLLPAASAAYARQLLSAHHRHRGGEQLCRWQPDLAEDPAARMPAALQPAAADAFRQGLPPTPQPSAVEAAPLPGTFGAFRLPAPAGGASAFTPGFPPLPAALQRRHTWSSVTGPPPDLTTNATLAAPMARLAPQQPPGFGILPPQYVHEQVRRGPRARRRFPCSFPCPRYLRAASSNEQRELHRLRACSTSMTVPSGL